MRSRPVVTRSVAARQNRGPGQRAAGAETSAPDRKQPRDTAPEVLVIMPLTDFSCAACGGSRSFLVLDDLGALCLSCADLDHLIFLPAGNAALSRRARTHNTLAAVVVRFSRSRGRYERQGILVEEAALQLAEEQCLSDADARLRRRERDAQRRPAQDLKFQRRLADQIRQLYLAALPREPRRSPGTPRLEVAGGSAGRPLAAPCSMTL